MHLNYYFLRFLSAELREKLIGYTFADCYLRSRYECVIRFQNGNKEFIIQLNLFGEFTCIAFPIFLMKEKKGTYNLFKDLNDLKVLDIIQHENDRSFHIVFENGFSLMFKLYGSRSNLILFHENNVVDILNKNLEIDRELELQLVHKHVQQDYENFVKEGEDVKKIFPAFDKEMLGLLYSKDYSSKDSAKWQLIQELISEVSQKVFYVNETNEGISLGFLPFGKEIIKTTSAMEACNCYERYAGPLFYFKESKSEVLNFLNHKIKKLKSYLLIVEQKLTEINAQTRYDEIANILMANLHQVPKNTEVVELFNFYTNEPIFIKVKKDLSPQKNAENYYRKAKNKKLEIAELQKNIEAKKSEKEKLEGQRKFVEDCEDFKLLRKFIKENNLEQEKVKKEKDQDNLFRRFEIDGFEVLIGKNAKNNDLLTQRYSFKEDLWLHARDVTGSHVLIKYKAGKKFPKPVIEKAAQLAAYYSKRKTDSLCPVIVTLKKYVRKPKGALEGQVVIEREEVIMVQPADFNQLKP